MKIGPLSCLVCLASLALPASVPAQAPAPATYDVATIKPADPNKPRGTITSMINWSDNSLSGDNVTIAFLLSSALDARPDQISGQPGWANDLHWDINAKLTDIDRSAASKLTEEQHRALIRALLVERFGLKYHEETRVMPVYEMLPAKGGLKLKTAAPVDKDKPGDLASGSCAGCAFTGSDFMLGRGVDTHVLASMLAGLLQRNVTDRTGATGSIDLDLKFAPEMGAAPGSDQANLPPLPVALEEQMGIHLVSTKGPVKTYVIDHLDKPTEN